jgi:hypothetical protein
VRVGRGQSIYNFGCGRKVALRYCLWAPPFRVAHAGLKPGGTLVPVERLIGEAVSLAILFSGNVGN